MRRTTLLLSTEDVQIADVQCRAGRSAWSAPEPVARAAMIFVRRGCFRRRADGGDVVLDASVVYCQRPGAEQQIAHPTDGGGACTVIGLSDRLLDALWGDVAPPAETIATTYVLDLQHRTLLSECRKGGDTSVLAERAFGLVAQALSQADPRRACPGRPTTAAARRRLIEDAREALACDARLTLTDLADRLHVSPYHLSRLFSAATGTPVSRYRNRLRARVALERLAEGEENLARLASELGFADHAHLSRTIRAELGEPPSRLRLTLGAPDEL